MLRCRGHCGIVGFGGKSSTESHTEIYLIFHLRVRAAHLNAQTYSQYQQFLYQEIIDFREKGWTFAKIANFLNEGGYSTVRGKMLNSYHVHSIVKKKRVRDKRLTRRYGPRLSNFGSRLIDRTLIDQVRSIHPKYSLSEFRGEINIIYSAPFFLCDNWR